VVWSEQSELNPILFSWHAGIGTAVKFSPHTGMLAEATYRKQTNNQFKNFPLDKRYGLAGLKIAVFVKF